MTREEIKKAMCDTKKEVVLKNLHKLLSLVEGYPEYEDCISYAIEKLEQEPRWIPVSERLPEDNKYYLVTIELTFSRSNRYVDIQNAGGWDSLRKCGHEVLAWMPLPKAYSEV